MNKIGEKKLLIKQGPYSIRNHTKGKPALSICRGSVIPPLVQSGDAMMWYWNLVKPPTRNGIEKACACSCDARATVGTVCAPCQVIIIVAGRFHSGVGLVITFHPVACAAPSGPVKAVEAGGTLLVSTALTIPVFCDSVMQCLLQESPTRNRLCRILWDAELT